MRNGTRRRLCVLSTATALMLAALLASAAAALANAPIPPIAGLTSPTHPDPAKWYANSHPSFFWQPAIGAAAYS